MLLLNLPRTSAPENFRGFSWFRKDIRIRKGTGAAEDFSEVLGDIADKTEPSATTAWTEYWPISQRPRARSGSLAVVVDSLRSLYCLAGVLLPLPWVFSEWASLFPHVGPA